MERFDSRAYSVNDFREWNERKELVLQPKFQRRNIWSDKARSYLIDTIVQGKPIPKIFMRQEIHPKTRKTRREIVDGQQRLRTIFSFLDDGFKISKIHSQKYGRQYFSQLPGQIQASILKYELSVDLLLDAPDSEVLDIFARLNTYAVKLNAQELRNSSYFGEFKQLVYSLALEYTSFWTASRIFTDSQILRMAETQLVSELVIAMMEGIKSRKVIASYYRLHDDELPRARILSQRFKKTMDTIGAIMQPEFIRSFSSPVLFYSLFCAVYHGLFGLPGPAPTKRRLKASDYSKIRITLEKVEELFESKSGLNSEEKKFVESMKRHTTDESVRVSRTKFLVQRISEIR